MLYDKVNVATKHNKDDKKKITLYTNAQLQVIPSWIIVFHTPACLSLNSVVVLVEEGGGHNSIVKPNFRWILLQPLCIALKKYKSLVQSDFVV